jgi:protein-export chaperone SecB
MSEETTQPEVRQVSQYIKDLSLKTQRGTAGLNMASKKRPDIDIGVQVQGNKLEDDHYESVIHLNVTAKVDGEVMFLVELAYGSVWIFKDVPQDQLSPLVLIHAPSMAFPFARRIIADVTRDGSFPPLMMDPIDFAALYRRNQDNQASGETETPESIN